MVPGPQTAATRDRALARLELDELKSAVRWLARERRQPDVSRLDPTTSAALVELSRLVSGEGEIVANPLSLKGVRASDGARYLVLAKLERYSALRSRGGDSLASGLLESLRKRLTEALPQARLGRVGHGLVEFSITVSVDDEVEALLSRLHGVLEAPFHWGEETFVSAVVLGAAAAPDHVDLSDVLAQADQALARAEAEGRKLAVFCDREREEASQRLSLMRDLRAAVRAEELTVAYQPKLNLRTGRIDSAEALLRWTHPVRGNVPPDAFIELAEDTGDIDRITEMVLTMAVRDQKVLAEAGDPPDIHVNLSGRLLAEEGFCRRALDILSGATGRIGVEITETAVIADPERALKNLHAFVEAGVSVAIDDYGSGLSSLAYLKTLPADELKIDKVFVMGLTTSHRDPLIVRSTIDLAHALEMQVTAEGVDDPAALALLQVMGCDKVQGFFISRPLALEGLQAFLAAPVREDLVSSPGRSLLGLRR